MQSKGKVDFVVDSAHGSSGKGAVSTRLVDIKHHQNASTCNSSNAGHTALLGDKKFVSKVLPTSAALNMFGLAKPRLWVGANSGFFIPQLEKELSETGYKSDGEQLVIHERAVIMGQRHIDTESHGGAQSTEHLASTMSGSGAAYAEKVMRLPSAQLAGGVASLNTVNGPTFVEKFRAALNGGQSFMHEVSQGYALSIDHGTHYPSCTYRNCTPQQAAADLLLRWSDIGDVYLNVRTFPIRVGNVVVDGQQRGYSGDFMADQAETTWEQIAKDAEFPPDEAAKLAEQERTTVTRRIRRVATQSWSLLAMSAKHCNATKLILNFPQYLHWSAHKVRGGPAEYKTLHAKVRQFVERMEDVTNLPVVMIGTGADHEDYIYLE